MVYTGAGAQYAARRPLCIWQQGTAAPRIRGGAAVASQNGAQHVVGQNNGVFLPRQMLDDVRPFCWTDLTIRYLVLSSVLHRTHSV